MRPRTPEPSGHRNRRPLKRALWPREVRSRPSRAEQLEALTHLLDSGVLTEAEYHELRARVAR